MSYEWDPEKNRANQKKHSVDFSDAVSALEDDDALTMKDEDVDEEDRFITLGRDSLGRLLVVVFMWRDQNIRLISARQATRRERSAYEGKR